MSRLGALSWLALRELWISFRLLVLLGAYLVAGTAVALLPPDPAATGGRYAVALAAATVVAAMVAAAALGRERRRGSAGWLVTRAVPRRAILVAWFLTLAAIALAGLIPGAILAWLTVAGLLPWADALGFGLSVAAVGAVALAAIALGLLLGVILPPRVAAVAALLISVAGAAGLLAAPSVAPAVPGAAFLLLAALAELPRPIGSALQAAGAGLAAAAVLLVAARLALERADL